MLVPMALLVSLASPQSPDPVVVASLAHGDPAVAKHADGGGAILGHELGHQVQAQPGHLLAVHLQDLVSNPQQPRIQLLCAAVTHLLNVHT